MVSLNFFKQYLLKCARVYYDPNKLRFIPKSKTLAIWKKNAETSQKYPNIEFCWKERIMFFVVNVCFDIPQMLEYNVDRCTCYGQQNQKSIHIQNIFHCGKKMEFEGYFIIEISPKLFLRSSM